MTFKKNIQSIRFIFKIYIIESMSELLKTLINSQNTVCILSKEQYQPITNRLIEEAGKKYDRIDYVALNKPYLTLKHYLESRNIPPKKFFFIDAITSTNGRQIEDKNCQYVTHPSALTEMNLKISDALRNKNPELTIVDSLSSLLVYNSESYVLRFVHGLINKIKESNSKGIYLILKSDITESILDDLALFSDSIIDYTIIQNELINELKKFDKNK